MQETLRSLSCGLAGTSLGHLAPSVCMGKAFPARRVLGVLLGQSVGTAAIAVCGERESHSKEQEQEHAAETTPVCTEKRRCWHARLIPIRVKNLRLNLVRAGLSVLQVSTGWGVMRLFPLGVTVNLALGREGWQKAFHMLWISTNFRPAGLA